MSQIVETDLGRFRLVRDDGEPNNKWWLWECPQCKQWGGLTDGQWNGTVSVHCECESFPQRYHQTHQYGAALVAALAAAKLTGQPLTKEDAP